MERGGCLTKLIKIAYPKINILMIDVRNWNRYRRVGLLALLTDVALPQHFELPSMSVVCDDTIRGQEEILRGGASAK